MSHSAPHDSLNADLLSLMRQQTGSGEKEIEVMGRKLVVLPEVFNVATLQPILEYIAHSPLKIVAEELKRRGAEAHLDVLEIGPGVGHFVVCAAALGPNLHVSAVDINPAAVANVRRNAELTGVSNRVQCAAGDVYSSPVTEGRRFDVIFWDPPVHQRRSCVEHPHYIGTVRLGSRLLGSDAIYRSRPGVPETGWPRFARME